MIFKRRENRKIDNWISQGGGGLATCTCGISYLSFLSVQKTFSQAGQSVNLSWSTAFFPSAGVYTIYHTNIVNRSVIELTSNGVTKMQKEKYEYHSYPYNSTHISFEIKNVSLEDAGYYAGGVTSEAAWLEGGIILIINGTCIKHNKFLYNLGNRFSFKNLWDFFSKLASYTRLLLSTIFICIEYT